MECSTDHANSREGSSLCKSCAASVGNLCPVCGSVNRVQAKFCSECGQRLRVSDLRQIVAQPIIVGFRDQAHSHTPTERRMLTVMFYDLAESTTIASQLDPEDLGDVIGAFHRCVSEQVKQLGGFVARYVGDGALVYFGYPQAHENDPERAIVAGLAAVNAVSRLTLLNGYRPSLRIGIATGLAIVGDIVGTGVCPEQDIAGEAPNLAARLQAVAEPDSLVICAKTQRLSGGLFDYSDLGELALKGFPEPQRVWRVIGKAAVDSRFEAQRAGGVTRLIGRRHELATLLCCWRRARAGSGQVVLLSGEAGIGKSRLASILFERLTGKAHTLRYFCSPHQQGSPLAPCISQLERAAGLQREDNSARKLEKLEAFLPAQSREGETVALLADLLSIPPSPRHPLLRLTPQQRRERTLDVLVRQIELLSRQGPVIALFEDVHWIDPTSAELLDRLVERIPRLPVQLVITFRPEFQAPWGRPHVTPVTLAPLSRQQGLSVVEEVAGGGALPQELLDEIVTRADGVPLFLEELTKAIIEARGPREARESFADQRARRDVAVPTTLHASLMARLDHLGSAKEVAQIGAAIGREFSFEMLAAVARKDQAELDTALRQLVNAGLVFRRGEPPNASFLFKHALVQDTAYSTLLRSTRRNLHARIVESLERLFPDAGLARPELIAHHYTEAGLVWEGAGYWLKAGQQALARSALVEAAAQLRKGLDVLAHCPESAERNRHELESQIALGKVLIATKGHAAADTGQTFARARELCDLLDQPPQIVSVLHGQWTHALLRAELRAARRRAGELLCLGEARGEQIWQVMGYRCFGVTSFPLGEFQTACDYLNRGLELFDPTRRSAFNQWTVDDVQIVMMYYSSWALLYLGHLDQARQRCDAALAEARRLAQPYTLAHALIASTLIRLILEEYEDAQHLLSEVLTVAEEHGISYFKVVGTLFHGRCLVELQCPHEAIERLTRSLAFYRASGSSLYLPTFLTYLAAAYKKAGKPRQAMEQLAEAMEIVERTETRCDEADMYCLKGEVQAMTGDPTGAEGSFRKSLAVARRQSARLFELRAAISLAQLWSDHARRADARDLVMSVRNRFTEGFDTTPLKKAQQMLGFI
jgi:predicted ATPase/class 3 adenylate cyclase